MTNSSKHAGLTKLVLLLIALMPSVVFAGFYDYDDHKAPVKPQGGFTGSSDNMKKSVEKNISTLRENRVETIMSIASPAQKELLKRREQERQDLERTFPHIGQ